MLYTFITTWENLAIVHGVVHKTGLLPTKILKFAYRKTRKVIADVQHIWSLIPREEYDIGRTVPLVSILFTMTKTEQNSIFVSGQIERFIKGKWIIIN